MMMMMMMYIRVVCGGSGGLNVRSGCVEARATVAREQATIFLKIKINK
jgi:hypothetical protein